MYTQCPCGIHRNDCDYHRPQASLPTPSTSLNIDSDPRDVFPGVKKCFSDPLLGTVPTIVVYGQMRRVAYIYQSTRMLLPEGVYKPYEVRCYLEQQGLKLPEVIALNGMINANTN